MMKKVCWIMVAVLAMGLPVRANLVSNGDFNTGDLSGWWTYVPDPATQSITIETVYTYDGTPNVKMASATDGSWQELGTSAFACSSETAYSLSLVYNKVGWVGGGINLKYWDSAWTELGYEWINVLSSAEEGTGIWTAYSYDFTSLADAAYMEVKISMGGWGDLYVDNVNVAPEPASLLLLMLGGLLLGRKRI